MTRKVAYVGAPLDFDLDFVVQVPVLRIVYMDLSGLRSVGGAIVFTSKRGVISLQMSGVKITGAQIYCIGHKTSEYLSNIYSKKCIVPGKENTDGLSELLLGREKSVTIVGSDKVSRKFISKLKEGGVDVRHIVAYKIEENGEVDYSPLATADDILIGSSWSFEILDKNASSFIKGKRLYAIGEPTSITMERLGYVSSAVFTSPDIREILQKLITKR